MKSTASFIALALLAGAAWGKLPAPSGEAKAKAAEAAAKAAHGDKVAAYQLCRVQDQIAAAYLAAARKAGQDLKPAATAPCTDPGPFVAAPAAAVATAAPAAPAPKKQ